MPKEKEKKVELTNEMVGLNPLAERFVIPVNRRSREVINKFGEPDEIEKFLESTPYVKVFDDKVRADGKHNINDLPLRSKELYLYVIHVIKPATDFVHIEKKTYMIKMGIKSVNTFKIAIRGLADNLYIYPHVSLKDVYWINPRFFFKGSRINKYPNSIRYNEKKAKSDKAGKIDADTDVQNT